MNKVPSNRERSISTTPSISLDAKDTRVLRSALKAAARSCQLQARLSMGMVVFSIISCIGILLLGDKVEDLFMSDVKRRALGRAETAKYKLLEKLASFDDKAIADMDIMYAQFRKEFGLEFVRPSGSELPVVTPDIKPNSSNAADSAKPSDPPVDLDTPPPSESDYVDAKTVNLPIEKYDALKKQIEGLQADRTKLKTERDQLEKLTDASLREQNLRFKETVGSLEKTISSKDAKLATADTTRDNLWKSREELNQKIGTLNEKLSNAAVMGEVRSIFSTAFIRGGALFLLVWLVKIFVRKHQHAVNGREFYSAALNALQIKGVRSLAEFKEALSLLKHGHFELRDADFELLSDKLADRVIDIVKPGLKS